MAAKTKLEEFENSWKDEFPGETVPRLSCFENTAATEGADYEQQFRKSLQVTLDLHSLRIDGLQKKLQQQQFIVEYIAKELEALPVPRQTGSTPFTGNNDVKPTPTPKPRKAPQVPKKPPKAVISEDNGVGGAIRRNHSTPSPRQTPVNDRRFHFASVFVPSKQSIEEATNNQSTDEEHSSLEQPKSVKSVGRDSESTDDRFQTFQGTTFGSSPRYSDNSKSSNAVSNPAAGSPAIIENKVNSGYETAAPVVPPTSKVGRNSMKQMNRISIQDTESSSGSSSPDGASNEYMQLWTNKPLADVRRSSSSASQEVSKPYNT